MADDLFSRAMDQTAPNQTILRGDRAKAKQASVRAATEAKTAAMGGVAAPAPSDSFSDIATAIAGNITDRLQNPEFANDLRRMSPTELDQKYGPEAVAMQTELVKVQLTDGQTKRNDAMTWNNAVQDLQQAGMGLATGAVTAGVWGVEGALNLGKLALWDTGTALSEGIKAAQNGEGFFDAAWDSLKDSAQERASTPATTKVAEIGNKLVDWVGEERSQTGKDALALEGAEAGLMKQARDRAYEVDSAAAKTLFDQAMAETAVLGRGAADFVENLADSPSAQSQFAAQAAASLIGITSGSAVASRGALLSRKMAEGMTRAEAGAFMKTAAGQAELAGIREAMVTPVTGALEGGSAGNQVVEQIMSLQEADLGDNEVYQDLRKQEMTHEEALGAMAANAVGGAIGVSGLAGAAIGKFMGNKFEANPFGVRGGVTNTLKTIGKEAIEETGQESFNQIGSNVGMIAAGEDTRLLEDVGQSAAAGFLGGLGMAGATQSIPMAGQAARAGVNAIDRYAQSRDISGEVGAEMAPEAMAATNQSVTEAVAATETETTKLSPAATQQLKTAFQAPQEIADFSRAADEQDKIGQPLSQHDVAVRFANGFNEHSDTGTKIYLATLAQNARSALMQGLADEGLNEVMSLPEDDPDRVLYEQATVDLQRLSQDPALKATQDYLGSLSAADIEANVTLENYVAQDPDNGAKDFADALLQLRNANNPHVADDAFVAKLEQAANSLPDAEEGLSQRRGGLNRNNAMLKKALNEAAQFARDIRKTAKTMAAAEFAEVIEDQEQVAERRKEIDNIGVSKEVYDIGFTDDNGSGEVKKKSLNKHRIDILEALDTGQFERAGILMDTLFGFAQHFVNKTEAINLSAETDRQGKGFRKFDGTNFVMEKDKLVWGDPKREGSVKNAVYVHANGSAVVRTFNTLLEIYGDQLGDSEYDGGRTALVMPELTPVLGDLAPVYNSVLQLEGALRQGEQAAAAAALVAADEQAVADRKAEEEGKAARRKEAQARDEAVNADEVTLRADKAARRAQQSFDEAVEDTAVETAVELEEDAVEDAAPKPAKRKALSELAGDLVRKVTKYAHAFPKSFNRRGTGQSSLEVDSPIKFVFDALNMPLQETYWDAASRSDKPIRLRKELGKLAQKMQQRFDEEGVAFWTKDRTVNKEGSSTGPKGSTYTMRGLSQTGDVDPASFENGYISQFMREDGTFDPRIVQTAFLAALEAIIDGTNRHRGKKWDDDRVRDVLNLPTDMDLSDEHYNLVEGGVNVHDIIDGTADRILSMMNLSQRDDVPISVAQGLPKALASTALGFLAEEGMITLMNETANRDSKGTLLPNNREYVTVIANTKGKPVISSIVRLLAGRDRVFSKAFDESVEEEVIIGTPPKDVKKSRIRQNFTKTTDKERQVLNRLQKQENRPVAAMWRLLDLYGEDDQEALETLLGREDVSEGNVALNERREAKNNLIRTSLTVAKRYREMAGDQPIFFRWAVSSVGRLQQRGSFTPQGNKFMRELISSTNSKLDLSNQDHIESFMLAVAQSLDLKPLAVEKIHHEELFEALQEMMAEGGQLYPALSAVKDMLASGKVDPDLRAKIEEAGVEVTPKALHALVAYSEYLQHFEDGKTTFETSLAFELDGKTDGPINALINMMGAIVTPKMVDVLARGGLFLGIEEMVTLNDYISGDRRGADRQWAAQKDDLYTLVAKAYADRMTTSQSSAFKLVQLMLPDLINKTDDTLEIGRNFVKNPLTVFLYGSGADGIAGKIAKQMLDNLLGAFDEMAKNPDLKVTDTALFNGNGELGHMLIELFGQERVIEWVKNPAKVRFTAADNKVIREAITTDVIEPLLAAIDGATGNMASTMRDLQRISQIQNFYAKVVFNREIEKRLNGRKSKRNLTKKDFDEALAEAKKLGPAFETGRQEITLTETEKNSSDTRLGRGLFKKAFSALAEIADITDVGVKISPNLNIAFGDGAMMQNIYQIALEAFDRSLAVFDGIEMSLENLKEASEAVNKAVMKGWKEESIAETVFNSFEQTMRYAKNLPLSEQEKSDLHALLRKGAKQSAFSNEAGALVWVRGQAIDNRARKLAMERMSASVDHMAGADMPAVRNGIAVTDMTEKYDTELVADVFDELFQEERQKLIDKMDDQRKKPVVQMADAESTAIFDELAEPVKKSGAKVLSGKAIPVVMKKLAAAKKIDPKAADTFWDLFREADGSKSTRLDGWKVYFGTTEQLNAQIRANKNLSGMMGPDTLGKTFPKNKVMFIQNVSGETLAHELIHALTAEAVTEHYADPEASSPETKAAFARLEKLMADFKEMRFSNGSKNPIDQAALALQEQWGIEGVADDDMSLVDDERDSLPVTDSSLESQMQEFLAWMLSNGNLIALGRRTQARHPILKMLREGLHKLAKLLGINSKFSGDVFSNIKLNAEIVMRARDPQGRAALDADRGMEQRFGKDDRLTRIEAQYSRRLIEMRKQKGDVLKNGMNAAGKKVVDLQLEAETEAALQSAVLRMDRVGIVLNAREKAAVKAVHAVVTLGYSPNPAAMKQMNDIMQHVIETIPTNTPQWRFISSPDATLADLVALSQVDPIMRDQISKVDLGPVLKKGKEDELTNNVDSFVQNVGQTALNTLIEGMLNDRATRGNTLNRFDALTRILGKVDEERSAVAQLLNKPVAQALDDRISGFVSDAAEKGYDKLIDAQTKLQSRRAPKSRLGKVGVASATLGLSLARGLTSALNKKTAASEHRSLINVVNSINGMQELRRAIVDIVGSSEDMNGMLKLFNRARSEIDSVRQDFRETVPKVLAKQFSRELTNEEWTNLQRGVANTDLMAFGVTEALSMLRDPSKMKSAISHLEGKFTGSVGKAVLKKADELAKFMVTKELSAEMQMNAYAIIVKQVGPSQGGGGSWIGTRMHRDLDRLISLYAMQKLDPAVLAQLTDLAKNESKGMDALLSMQAWVRDSEMAKLPSDPDAASKMMMNAWKGYAASVPESGAVIEVAPVYSEGMMKMRGFTRIGDYKGADADGTHTTPMAYYQTDVGGLAAYRQGVTQTVEDTFFGSYALSGGASDYSTAGRLYADEMKIARNRLARGRVRAANGEHLIPIYDHEGNVFGFQLGMSAQMANAIQADNHMGRMLGVWAGRQIEEDLAKSFNEEVVKKAYAQYQADRRLLREDEYVNIAKSKDPVLREAWSVIPPAMKTSINNVFGQGEFFPIRKDALEDVVGYRAASIRDVFTNNNRLPKMVNEAIRSMALLVSGDKAYRQLVLAENLLRDFVGEAKTTIVVRSIIVPMANAMSNIFHLMARGVPIGMIARGVPQKLVEINQYAENRQRLVELAIERAKGQNAPTYLRRVEAEMRRIETQNKQMSIWPLIEAGEFNTISEDLTEADVSIRKGKLSDWIIDYANKLPDGFDTAAKTLLITKDTKLFQALNRSVQYGDFIAKAIQYDHMTQNKGMSIDETLDDLRDEYVNYNRPAGRARDYLESMGMLWFWNYKMRIMRIVARGLRENPASMLLMSGFVSPAMGVDTVVSGSLAGGLWKGTLGYGIGPGMGLNAISLNPFYNLVR